MRRRITAIEARFTRDLVCIQRPEYGGGEIYFDNKLIEKTADSF